LFSVHLNPTEKDYKWADIEAEATREIAVVEAATGVTESLVAAIADLRAEDEKEVVHHMRAEVAVVAEPTSHADVISTTATIQSRAPASESSE